MDARRGTLGRLKREWLARVGFSLGALAPFVTFEPSQVRRLVFVCLGNLNRSAFAAQLARQRGVPVAAVTSFGLRAPVGVAPPPQTLNVAGRLGVDLFAHRAEAWAVYEHEYGDLLLVMEVAHAHALRDQGLPLESIALLGHWATPQRWHLEDPNGLSEAYCEACFERLSSAVSGLLAVLRAGGSPALQQRNPALPPSRAVQAL